MLKTKHRLTKRGSFAYVYKKGGCYGDRLLKLFCVRSNGVKIGFSVSNKLGKATVRNKIKRRLRAAVREYADRLSGTQAVFLARQEIVSADYSDIKDSVQKLLIKAGLLTIDKQAKDIKPNQLVKNNQAFDGPDSQKPQELDEANKNKLQGLAKCESIAQSTAKSKN